MVTENINIDVRPGGIPIVIHVTQYEVGLRKFVFTPYTSNGTQTVVAGSATLEGTKPDGYAFQQACEMIDGVITYTLQEQLCAVEGRVWSRLVIRDTDGGMIGYTAIVWVVGCAGVKDDAVMSDSDISALRQFLDEFGDIDAYRGALNGALAAVGGPLVAATASAMTDTTKVYVYTGSESGYTEGHWYYWSGSAWTDGGVYQSTGINTDKTLTVEDMAADAKATGDAVAELKNDLADLNDAIDATLGNSELTLSDDWELGSINTQTGTNVANNARLRTSGYIDISACSEIKFTITAGYKYWWYLYDAEGTLLRQRQAWATSDTEINSVIIGSAVQMRIVMSNTNDTAASVDYAQYLTITGASKLKAIVDGTAETASSIDHTMGVDIEETVSDVQQHFYFAPFKQGDTLQVSVTWTFTGSGDKNVNIKDDTGENIKVIYSQGVYKFELPRDSEYIIVTLAKVSTVTTFTATYSIKSGMTLTLDSMYSDYQHTYYVEKDGSGDFTRLTDAIREACQYMNSVVYVGDGEWDLIAELGAELDDISSSNWGLYLSNSVHIIFSSNSKVTANYTGSNTNVLKYFSPFNTGEHGFTLENATIEASRCRYCVHDERGEETDHYESRYINCNMLMDNSNNEAWSTAQCIGGGLGRSAYIDIDGCVFDSNMWGGIVSYHNCAYANSKSNVNLHNSYFKRHGTFRFSWYGVSTEITTAYVSGCSFDSEIVHRAENESATVENTAVVEWNNIVRS